MKFQHFGFTDAGKIRNLNQDSFMCNGEAGLFLVADGIGGHASGETASLLAVESIQEFVLQSRANHPDFTFNRKSGLTMEQSRLLTAAHYANRCIHEHGDRNPETKGMGTTLVGSLIEGDALAVVNVGDSRLYRIREERIERLTSDHTVVQEQEREGILSREEARRHPHRHILTRALGVNENPLIDVMGLSIQANDLYLLCSDGLHGVLEDGEILNIALSLRDKPLYRLALSLILKANLAGGPDNITVVLVAFEDPG